MRPLCARCFCVLGIIVRAELEMIAATLRAQRAASGKNCGPSAVACRAMVMLSVHRGVLQHDSVTKRTGRLRVAEELARVVASGHVPLNQKMCGKEGPPGPRFRAKASPAGAEFTNGVMN